MKQTVLFVLSLYTLTACSTMNQAACLNANWSEIGFTDGAAGRTQTYFNTRASDCAKHNILADTANYNRGRKSGLSLYCTQNNGYDIGRNGKTYYGVCQGNAQKKFLQGYEKGKTYYRQQSEVNTLSSNIRHTERNISNMRKQKVTIEDKIIHEQISTKRAQLMIDLKQKSRDITRLEKKLHQLKNRHQAAQIRLDQL